jgi:hypothetical protein
MADTDTTNDSVFQVKYIEFLEDLLGALPEYTTSIEHANSLSESERLKQFQEQVKVGNTLGGGNIDEFNKNPGTVLPGVRISDEIWATLSDNTKKAIWEHVRILSICAFMEGGFGDETKPAAWMEDAMKDLKEKLDGVNFQDIIKKFAGYFNLGKDGGDGLPDLSSIPGLENIFNGDFPKLPDRFLKGHMARLADEIVSEIQPEDLGLTKEILEEAKKTPSRAFQLLFGTLGNNPDIIQKTIKRIGGRLSQKIMSGAIRPTEIAREAEELMKEFADNTKFVEALSGIKSAFGFEDLETARSVGREGSARLATAKERLRKKMEQKKQARSKATKTNETNQ